MVEPQLRKRTFYVLSDPSHAWIKVSRDDAKRIMGHQFHQISHYSYQKGSAVYLEEDSDAALFIECCRQAGIEPVLRFRSNTSSRPSRVRSYPMFDSRFPPTW